METVEVLVRVFDRGQLREEIVQVETECFRPGHLCWKSIAALKAAVLLELPFVQVERSAKYGMRPESKARLQELFGGEDGAHCAPLQETGKADSSPSLRITEGGTGYAERV